MNTIIATDKTLFLFLNSLHAQWADTFFFWLTQPWIGISVLTLLCVWMFVKWRKKSIAIIIALIIGLALADQSCNFLKHTIKRLRPGHDPQIATMTHLVKNPDGSLYRGGLYSFPSGHAATSMFAVLLIVFVLPRRHWYLLALLFGWVLLYSYSRIYLGVHYPLDILCGYLLGAFWAIIAFFLLRLPVKAS